MGQQTLDRPTADVEEHKYKPAGPDKAIDCTETSCKPISMEQLQKDLGPEQFKRYQEHAASEATKNEYFHPDSPAGKMMNNFSIDSTPKDGKSADSADATDKTKGASKKDAGQDGDLFGDKRNDIPGDKKQDGASDKTKEDAKVDDKPKSEWDKKIEASGAFTVGQAKDAYNAAAADKNGIAIIIGSKDTPGSKELLDKLPELQKENPNLKFMFVDKDAVAQKLAENPNDKSMQNWDKWIKDSQKDCNGQPIDLAFTSVQSVKADENGKVGPDKVTSTHWTADINAGLQDQGRYAADATARNLANANLKLDFTPPANVPKAETKEEPKKEQASEKPNAEVPKEETPFLKDEKEQVDNKAKEEQAAKEAQAREAAERKLEEQKPKEVDTRTVFKEGHVNEALAKAKAEGKPVIFEVGLAGTDGSNYCPPCRAFNAQMEPKLEQTFKDKAVVIKIDPTRDPVGASAIPGYPGRFPYSGAGYVDNQGRLQSVGGGMLGFAGADSWTNSINQRVEQAKQQIKRQQR